MDPLFHNTVLAPTEPFLRSEALTFRGPFILRPDKEALPAPTIKRSTCMIQ